jgi:hypothetical protein
MQFHLTNDIARPKRTGATAPQLAMPEQDDNPRQLPLEADDFFFYLPTSPYEDLCKALGSKEKADEERILPGPISSNRHDLQGDLTLFKGLEEGIDTFRALGMPVDWNHLSIKTGEPKWIIGQGKDLFVGPAIGGGEHERSRHCRGSSWGARRQRMNRLTSYRSFRLRPPR